MAKGHLDQERSNLQSSKKFEHDINKDKYIFLHNGIGKQHMKMQQ